jgi:L-fuconolactonase
MRIDTHQHFWRYRADEYPWIDARMAALQRDCLPGEVAAEMTAIGFDAAIAVQARQTMAETRALLALADLHPFIAGVVGWVVLCASSVEADLAALADAPTLVGVRHVVQGEPDGFLARADFRRGVSHLAHLGLTYDLLIYERQMPAAIEFVRAFPGQRFVLDHLGKPDIRAGRFDAWAGHIRALAGEANVTCKLSGLVTEADWAAWTPASLRPYLDAAVDAFGPDRLMIGSDWPVCTVAGTYRQVMDIVLEYFSTWPADARAAVFGGTAAALWSLPRVHASRKGHT